tara:strand:+ start:3918 stop:4682 length:765 start_codon:yes stop_codon:yes gene_type:complete
MIHFITICATNKHNKSLPAIDLYKGGYWNIVKEISNIVDKTWIISTKYGLIPSTQIIEPYKLSFKPDSKDYVGHLSLNSTEYWDKNNNNSISSLIQNNPQDKFILYASFAYIKAIKNDLLPVINNPNLFIFSPDTKGKQFKPFILNTSLKARYILGGNKITITAKTINHFLDNIEKIGWDKENINSYFKDMVKDCPEYEYKPVKEKIDDIFLIKLIKEIGSTTPKTSILKNISNKGFACGPNRLSRILNQINKL